MKKAEIRKHYFLDSYVIFAPKRNLRLHNIHEDQKEELDINECYFCPKNLKDQKIIQDFDNKKYPGIAIIENKFPALTPDNPKAFGKQEVIIETPEHNKELSDLPLEDIMRILRVYDQRIKELKKLKGVRHVLVFKNDGGKAGATVAHAHSQIIALPLIPPKIVRESDAVDEYFLNKGTCPHCDIIRKEMHSPRVAYLDDNVIGICPYASSNAFGVWIMPLKHQRTIDDFHGEELESLAKALKKITGKLDDAGISYNYFFDNSLDLESHHFRLKVEPRINIWAGLELGTGMVINPVFPEDSAKFYNS